jgi:regulator of protease activity HflC (stomatin/prohibitin superfamily)
MIVALVVAGMVLVLVGASLRVLKEYERGVAFRLGRLREPLGPGVRILVPGLDRLIRVDLRLVTLTIPPQEVITRDNVPARVNAVVLFRVVDPVRSVMSVENHAVATSQIAQTTLRSVVGRADLDTLLAHRADLNEDLAKSIAVQTEPWGVEVAVVEIKDVEIPEAMQRAMAREAEAERERRAKVISAHGELQASAELRDAAKTLSESPASLQLRYLQTLLEIGSNQNTTVVFPLPMDVLEPFIGRADHNAGGSKAKPRPKPPAPPGGGEPVPGVEASVLPPEPDPGPEPLVPPEDDSPAEGAPAPGGGSRPMPGVTEPEDDAPADPDLPPSRS